MCAELLLVLQDLAPQLFGDDLEPGHRILFSCRPQQRRFLELGKPTPLHVHPGDDEVLYVLEGEILVHVDGQEHRVGEGGVFVAPRGVPHAFLVTSENARLLCLTVPGTGWAEVQYNELCEPANADAVPGSRPPDFSRVRDVAERSDTIEILGPPPFDSVQRQPITGPA